MCWFHLLSEENQGHFSLSTSGIVRCFHVHDLELAQDEHSWSALFPSGPVGLPVYPCVSNNLVPRKREELQQCSLLHIPPEELHTMFTENSGSWDRLTDSHSLTNNMTPGFPNLSRIARREEMHMVEYGSIVTAGIIMTVANEPWEHPVEKIHETIKS